MTTTENVRRCPACSHDNAEQKPLPYAPEEWRIKRCGGCGFVYLENPVPYDALAGQFAWEKSFERERDRRERERSGIERSISRFLKSVKYRMRPGRHAKIRSYIERFIDEGRVLDVGCGAGATIDQLESRYVPYGVEISPELARESGEKARARGGDVVCNSALDGIAEFDAASFDGVVMRAYLEHETDPAPVLRHAATVLRPGGALIIKVPNFASINRRVRGRRWCGFRHPDHVNYFTPRSLRRMVEETGFDVTHFESFPLNDNMWLVARRRDEGRDQG